MLNSLYIAELEYRERIRQFNVRAARGDFILYPDNDLESLGPVQWSERLGKLVRAIRHRLGRQRSLVVQSGVDSA